MLQDQRSPVQRKLSQEQLDRLLDLCEKWAGVHPAWVDRLAKARLLVQAGEVHEIGVQLWTVASSEGFPHRVEVAAGVAACTCKWNQERHTHCSHILACGLFVKLHEPKPKPKTPRPPVQLRGLSVKRDQKRLGERCAQIASEQQALKRVALCGTAAT